MHRTTVHLPDELREQLARAAKEDHRSEAELIREGVERVLRERQLQRPRARLPLVESGHPGLGLALDWFFADTPNEVLDWLVEDCQSVWAGRAGWEDGGFFARQGSPGGVSGPASVLQVGFVDSSGVSRWRQDVPVIGPEPKLAQTWAHVCWSLELWRRVVMECRHRPEGFEVLVLSRWQPDQPPLAGEPAVEIARVEVGPRVGGVALSGR